jgi:prepilin-type N-terminal cleavage/methylation domain-containing protein
MHRPGFTLIEFLVTVAVFGVGLTLVSLNLLSSQHRADMGSSVQMLLADIRATQFKAMRGGTEGRSDSDYYGIKFNEVDYVIFHGSSYVASDASNVVIALPQSLRFSEVTWPGGMVIFAKGSGEVLGWIEGYNEVRLTDESQGVTKTIELNQLGVVSYVN